MCALPVHVRHVTRAVIAPPQESFVAHHDPSALSLQKVQMHFTSEFLRKMGLLDAEGKLNDLAGLPIHLYHDKFGRNNAAFLFTYLLRTGVLDEFTKQEKAIRVKVCATLPFCCCTAWFVTLSPPPPLRRTS